MQGAQTRLRLDEEQTALLDGWLSACTRAARTLYQRIGRGLVDPKDSYAFLASQGTFTARQMFSIINKVEQWRSTDKAWQEQHAEQLRLRIRALEQAVEKLDRQLSQGVVPKAFLRRRPNEVNSLRTLRFGKQRSLCSKRQKLANLKQSWSLTPPPLQPVPSRMQGLEGQASFDLIHASRHQL